MLQWPNPRPLANGIGQSGTFGGEIGGENVVHVTAMVHHKYNACFSVELGKLMIISKTQAHSVNTMHNLARNEICRFKIHQRVEGGNNLTGDLLYLEHQHRARYPSLCRQLIHQFQRLIVMAESIYQYVAPG